MLATMETEPEVMGTPGRVRDMIARFSHLEATPTAKVGTKRNGSTPTSPVDYDVIDNHMSETDDVRLAFRPMFSDMTSEDPTCNNNNKIYRHELMNKHDKPHSENEESDNLIMNYRRKLRPVANSVIVTDSVISDDVTHTDNDVTSPVIANGSEPSLLSRNGQRSSTTASKRTLVSQDTDPSPQKADGNQRASSQPTLLDGDVMPSTMTTTTRADDFDSVDSSTPTTTPKTPSYMKISCALSGYNRYNTYTSPKQEARLKVIKKTEQNGSHSSLSSQQSDNSSSGVANSSELSLRMESDTGDHTRHHNNATTGRLQNGSCNKGDVSVTTTTMTSPALRNGDVIVTNGRTERSGADMAGDHDNEHDDRLKYVTDAMADLHPAGCDVTSVPELKLPLEDPRKAELRSAVSTPSPSKDGYYYFPVLDREVARIRSLCAPCEADIATNSLPEEACGKLRATIGKSNLLINKKFQQFRGLCERNISQASDEAFQTTVTDLAGFWDMVSLQISDIDTMFADIEKMRQSGWKVVKDSPVKHQSTLKGGAKKSPRSKDTASSTPAKSAKSEEAARARDLARKRLLAAKRAGRQRKASQSDKDEIEIFVAE